MKRFALPLVAAVGISIPALAHGIECEVTLTDAAVLLACQYDHGTPVSGASVQVLTEATEPFQHGKTDRMGGFAFIPSGAETWRVIVDDGTGHREQVDISLERDDPAVTSEMVEHTHADESGTFTQVQTDHDREEIPLLYKLVFGLALIFGTTGILYGMKARQKQS